MKEDNIILYKTADGKSSVSLYAIEGNVWLSQNQLAELFATSKQNISLHIINILKDGELDPDSVVKDYLTTAGGFELTFYRKENRKKIELLASDFHPRDKQIHALEYLTDNIWITNEIYQQLNQCSRNIATKDLQELLAQKLILREGKGRYSKYKLK